MRVTKVLRMLDSLREPTRQAHVVSGNVVLQSCLRVYAFPCMLSLLLEQLQHFDDMLAQLQTVEKYGTLFFMSYAGVARVTPLSGPVACFPQYLSGMDC